ncbi:glycosyltransferase family 39 protein, partial [Patescibacteria group bacterium]|nr:glycosyltransferase family 39 protein [Patescibacteria group bacterium]
MAIVFFERRWKYAVGVLVTLAFLISLGYSFSFRIQPFADGKSYDAIAVNLLSRREYRENTEGPLANDRGITPVGPGYEFFLAGVFFLFGRHYEAVWALQALFHALTVLLVFLIAKKMFGAEWKNITGSNGWSPVAGMLAAGFVAFSPDLIIASSMMLTENVAIFLLALTMWLATSYWREGRLWYVFLMSLTLGFSVLVRSTLLLLFFVFLVLFWLRKRFLHMLIFIIVFLAVMTPWTVRNYFLYRAFVPTSITFGDDFLAGNHPQASGELDESRYPYIEKYQGLSYLAADREEIKDTVRFIAADPLHFLKLTVYRVSVYFSFSRPTGWWFFLSGANRAITLLLSSLYSVLLFSFGFFGAWRGWKDATTLEQKQKIFLFFASVLMMPFSIMFIIVETRYRYPIYPLLAVFAGYGAWILWRDRKKVLRDFLIVFVLLFSNTLFDVARNWSRIVER